VLFLLAVAPVVAQPEGFAKAAPGYGWSFPRDHGSHPEYQTEWWYYTGHLEVVGSERELGFHFTTFRMAVDEEGLRAKGVRTDSNLALDTVFWSHFAISDYANQAFHQTEILNRQYPGVAEARTDYRLIRNGRWLMEALGETHHLRAELRDAATGKTWDARLALTAEKPPTLHGIDGYSQKGPDPGQASMYYSFTRLRVEGTILEDGKPLMVRGSAWQDHEFMTNLLSEEQQGWDWFSIQLDDGTELMVYNIRLRDGGVEPKSKGTFVAADGSATGLEREDYAIETVNRWRSPHTGAEYPAGWKLRVAKLGIELEVTPRLADQEMRTERGARANYWEGACAVRGTREGKPVMGRAYAELVGYDKPLETGLEKRP